MLRFNLYKAIASLLTVLSNFGWPNIYYMLGSTIIITLQRAASKLHTANCVFFTFVGSWVVSVGQPNEINQGLCYVELKLGPG